MSAAHRPWYATRPHYGWVVLAVSVLTVLGSIGLARFGYTLILPAMQDALRLSNTQTGALATANFLGYVALSVLGGVLASRYGPRWVIAGSMFVTGLALLLTGTVVGFVDAFVWRLVAGAASGGANIPVMSLVPAWFSARRRGMATGITVGGSSLGLIAMGWAIPRVLESSVSHGWRHSWFMLGAAVMLLAAMALLLRDRPADMGLLPVGSDVNEFDTAGCSQVSAPSVDPPCDPRFPEWRRVYRSRSMWHLAVVYVAFGFSYVIYATFFAKYLVAEGGYTRQAAGNLWAIIGWISVLSGLAWGSLSDKLGRKYALALVYLIQACSFAIFALWRSPPGHVASVIAFGITGWSIPGIIAATCSDYVGSRLAPAAFGLATLFFGFGQVAGPTVAGLMADAQGTFGVAFLLAAGVALLGAVGALVLRPPKAVFAA